jgi:hypothetical protein
VGGWVLRTPTSNVRWPENGFISRGNSHLRSQFYGIELGPTLNSKTLKIGKHALQKDSQKVEKIYKDYKYI